MYANSPQILLSVCYLGFNNLFTRLQTAVEWARYGVKYLPLRVTDPKVGTSALGSIIPSCRPLLLICF